MNTEPWVTAEQVAQHLGVVKDTVYRSRERKGLPAHKICRRWKFQLSEINERVRAGGADEEQRSDGQTPSLKNQGDGLSANIELDRQRSRRQTP